MKNQEILDFIQSRRSMGNLIAPAPTADEIEQAIAVAATAPDHKQLMPWRFVVLQGDSLEKFGQALKQAAIADGETDDATLTKTASLPHRAPMIITCHTHYQPHPKVPKFEQLLSVGAATQNLLLALHAMGYATVWRTGLLANSAAVKAFFGVDDTNDITGFIYVGTAAAALPRRIPMDVELLVRYL